MLNIQTPTYSSALRDIKYYCIQFDRLSITRLTSAPEIASRDFCEFYSASPHAPRAVLASSMYALDFDVIPEDLHYSLDRKYKFLSITSILNYWGQYYVDLLHNKGSQLLRSDLKNRIINCFNKMLTTGSLSMYLPEDWDGESQLQNFVVGGLGYLKDASALYPKSIVTCSGYSIIDEYECFRPFQSIRDPIGFRAENGRVTSLPLYDRPCIVQTSHGIEITTLTKSEFDISLLGGHISTYGNVAISVYTPEHLGYFTPPANDAVEIIIVENKAVGISYGGNTKIPRAGVVLRSTNKILNATIVNQLSANTLVNYSYHGQKRIYSGLQCGPTLIDNGKDISISKVLQDQYFVNSKNYGLTTAPNGLQRSAGAVQAARSCIGTTSDGKNIAIIVEGMSTNVSHGESRPDPIGSLGATFREMQEIGRNECCHNLMALDSGGSVGLYDRSRKILESGDHRFENIGQRVERPLAHAVILD